MDLVVKAQQFLAEEQELLADFLLDMENVEDSGKNYAKAAALWAVQTARVAAIKDVLVLMEIPEEEKL
ncbi:MAG: hypothetical protein ABS951_06765 [Solibacillus sp.]